MLDLIKYKALLDISYQGSFSTSIVGLLLGKLIFKPINQGIIKALLELIRLIKLLNKRPLISYHF